MKLRDEAEANRSEIPHYIRNKLRNLAFSEEIATVENDLAMTDAIDTCNSYRWIWVLVIKQTRCDKVLRIKTIQ